MLLLALGKLFVYGKLRSRVLRFMYSFILFASIAVRELTLNFQHPYCVVPRSVLWTVLGLA